MKFWFNLFKLFLIINLSIVIFLAAYFKITAPEGSAILWHYCFAKGEDLTLKSDYIPNSPVVLKELRKMKIGQDKTIRFSQEEDWRLSYALNPFHLVKTKSGFKIYQYIKFDTKGIDRTVINLHLFKFTVQDRWVYLLNPKPFMVYYRYSEID
jgi:hypothetical protein